MSIPFECYLHIEHCQSGQTYTREIKKRTTLNLEERVKEWIKEEFCGELRLDGKITPKLEGEYYAAIYTDNCQPEGARCWTGGGFYLKAA